MRRIELVFAVLLLAAQQGFAYTIFLKDGSRLVAREKYRVVGNKAQIVLPNGARTELALSEIDVPQTERANASDFGDAVVLEGPAAGPTPTPVPRGPSLSDVAAARPQPVLPAARPTPTPVDNAARQTTQRTDSGAIDLLRAQRTPLARAVATPIAEALRANGIESVSLYEGTSTGRVLLDITTNSEGAVFQALNNLARAMVLLDERRPGAVPPIEVFMATDRRQRAGQFLLTPERARELTEKQLDVTTFFLKYVEF